MLNTGTDLLRELLEQVRKTHEVSYRSTVDLSVVGFQQLGLVHMGSVGGILAYLATSRVPPTTVLILAMAAFVLGIVANLAAIYHARYGQQFQTDAHAAQLEGVQKLIQFVQLLTDGTAPPDPTAWRATRDASAMQYQRAQELANKRFATAGHLGATAIVLFPIGAALTAMFFFAHKVS